MPSIEELNQVPTVDTGGPILSSYDVRHSGNTEFTQAVVAGDDVVAFSIRHGLNWFIVDRRVSGEDRRPFVEV